MLKILRKSFPVKYSSWKTIMISSFAVFFILTLFQPFGLSNLGMEKWFRIVGFTGVTACSTSIITVLPPLLFTKYYSVEKGTIGKYLINNCLIILVIGFGNFIFDWNVTNRPSDTLGDVFLSYFLITFMVGIIPITLISFISQNYILKQNLKEATLLNKNLLNKTTTINSLQSNDDVITLTGATKEKLTLLLKSVLYIESSGNYAKVYYLGEKKK